MNIKHFFKLIIPRLTWLKNRISRTIYHWKRLKTVNQLQAKEVELKELYIFLTRKNTDESNALAIRVDAKLEIINWILENGV